MDMMTHRVHVCGKGAGEVEFQEIKGQPTSNRHMSFEKRHERSQDWIL